MRQHLMKSRFVSVLLLVGLALLTAWSWSCLAASAAASRLATEDLLECRRLAQEIKRLGKSPQKASLEARSSTQLTKLVEESARSAQLSPQSVVAIDPQPARRMGETGYREQLTHVELREMTLRQLVTFLLALSDEGSGIEVASLRLRAPRDEKTVENNETWAAEVTLTQVVFAP